jgi:hypothetical protein
MIVLMTDYVEEEEDEEKRMRAWNEIEYSFHKHLEKY